MEKDRREGCEQDYEAAEIKKLSGLKIEMYGTGFPLFQNPVIHAHLLCLYGHGSRLSDL